MLRSCDADFNENRPIRGAGTEVNPIEELSQKIDALIARVDAASGATRWLTLEVAARYCSTSTFTILRWIKSAKIYGAKRGKQWYVDRLGIDTFMTVRKG